MTHLENKLTEYGRAHPGSFDPKHIPLWAVQEVIDDYLDAVDDKDIPPHRARAEFCISDPVSDGSVRIAWYLDVI